MRIITRGQIPEDNPYRATCYHCKTVVEFFQKEGKITRCQRDGDSVTVICPLCKKYITVDL